MGKFRKVLPQKILSDTSILTKHPLDTCVRTLSVESSINQDSDSIENNDWQTEASLKKLADEKVDPLALLLLGRRKSIHFKSLLKTHQKGQNEINEPISFDLIIEAIDYFRASARLKFAEGCRHLAFSLWQLAVIYMSAEGQGNEIQMKILTEFDADDCVGWIEEAIENLRLAIELGGGPSLEISDESRMEETPDSPTTTSNNPDEYQQGSPVIAQLITTLGKWFLFVAAEKEKTTLLASKLPLDSTSYQRTSLRLFIVATKFGSISAAKILMQNLSQNNGLLNESLLTEAVHALESTGDTSCLKFLTSYYRDIAANSSKPSNQESPKLHQNAATTAQTKCMTLLHKLAFAGDGQATLTLASAYHSDVPSPFVATRNPRKALRLYLNAAKVGDFVGVRGATGLLLFGDNNDKAKKLKSEDVKPDEISNETEVDDVEMESSEVKENIPMAVSVYAQSAKKGFRANMKQLGDVLISLVGKPTQKPFEAKSAAKKMDVKEMLALWCYATEAFGFGWSFVAEDYLKINESGYESMDVDGEDSFLDCENTDVTEEFFEFVLEISRHLNLIYPSLLSLLDVEHQHEQSMELTELEAIPHLFFKGAETRFARELTDRIESVNAIVEIIQQHWITERKSTNIVIDQKWLIDGLNLHAGMLGGGDFLNMFASRVWEKKKDCAGCKEVVVKIAAKMMTANRGGADVDEDLEVDEEKFVNWLSADITRIVSVLET